MAKQVKMKGAPGAYIISSIGYVMCGSGEITVPESEVDELKELGFNIVEKVDVPDAPENSAAEPEPAPKHVLTTGSFTQKGGSRKAELTGGQENK